MEPAPSPQLAVTAASGRYAPDDERWLAQVDDLFRELRREVGTVSRHQTPTPGAKGGLETIIVALGTAGVFEGLVTAFRFWLQRDRSRRIEVTFGEDRLVIDGENIDSATLQTALQAALESGAGR